MRCACACGAAEPVWPRRGWGREVPGNDRGSLEASGAPWKLWAQEEGGETLEGLLQGWGLLKRGPGEPEGGSGPVVLSLRFRMCGILIPGAWINPTLTLSIVPYSQGDPHCLGLLCPLPLCTSRGAGLPQGTLGFLGFMFSLHCEI